jgi:hypothetical protein
VAGKKNGRCLDARWLIFVSWASARLPGYRPTMADAAAAAMGMHERDREPIVAVPVIIKR